MKKLLGIFMVAMLLVLAVAPAALAAENPTLTVSSTSANLGEEIVLSVSLSNNTGFSSLQFTVDYDESVIKLTSFTNQVSGNMLVDSEVSTAKFAVIAVSDITTNGMVCEIAFNVLDSAALGSTSVSLNDVEITTDGGYTKLDTTIVPGTVTVNETEHLWDEGSVTHEATCSEEGEMTYTCQRCGATKTESIAKLPHTEETVKGYAATCTDDGLTDDVKCSVCGEVIVEQEIIPATGHTPDGEGEVVTEATYDHDGEIVYTCIVCGNEYSEIIPMLKYKVTLPVGEGYTVVPSSTEIAKGESLTFTIEIDDGYEKAEGFAVKVNGEAVTPDENGVYTVENVDGDIEISVDGVKATEQSNPTDNSGDKGDGTTPVTSDNIGIMVASVAVLALAGFALCMVMRRKGTENR